MTITDLRLKLSSEDTQDSARGWMSSLSCSGWVPLLGPAGSPSHFHTCSSPDPLIVLHSQQSLVVSPTSLSKYAPLAMSHHRPWLQRLLTLGSQIGLCQVPLTQNPLPPGSDFLHSVAWTKVFPLCILAFSCSSPMVFSPGFFFLQVRFDSG